jgi:hypothetical protein
VAYFHAQTFHTQVSTTELYQLSVGKARIA